MANVAQIQYKSGKFLSFIATRSFSLAATGLSLQAGEELLFDGTTVEVAGATHNVPQLRGAAKAGWLVLAEDYSEDAEVEVVRANIGIRPCVNDKDSLNKPPVKKMMVITEPGERIVGTSKGRAAEADQITKAVRAGVRTATNAKYGIVEAPSSEGVVIPRNFKTSAKSNTKLTPDSAGAAEREAAQVKIEPGQGISQEDFLARMPEYAREEYLAKIQASRASKGLDAEPVAPKRPVRAPISKTSGVKVAKGSTDIAGEEDGKVVGTVGGSGTGVVRRQETLEDIEIRTSVLEEPVSRIEKDGTADMRRKIAKSLCSDFPETYNFDDHWKRRLAMIRLNYEDRHDVIRAIFAAESDEYKKLLMEEFPEAFS